MTPDQFRAEVGSRLAAAGYAVEQVALPGAPAVVGRRKLFRVRWFLTQLKVSVVVATVDNVTPDGWQRFANDAFEVAHAIKGGLPTGIQSGIASVPVLAAAHVDPYAAGLARERPRVEWFTGVAMPALVDLTTGQVHQYEGSIVVGAVYAPFLRKQRDLVTSIVHAA